MKRALPILALTLAALAALVAPATGQAASGPASGSAKAYVILAPGLAWSDITPTGTPTLWRMASTGAVGDLNAMLRAREGAEAPSAQEGALDVSAGNWASPEFAAVQPLDVAEPYEGMAGAQAYGRRAGTSPGSAQVVYPGMPPAVRKSTVSADDVVIGTLGSAVGSAGGQTVAVGNSDSLDTMLGYKLERPAALAAMDGNGLVRFGEVSRALLATDSSAPWGMRTDLAAFARALDAAEASASAAGGPALIVLDPGDAYRAARFAWQVSDPVAREQHDAALTELDRVAALALQSAGGSGLVMVAGQAPPADPVAGMPGFSPLLVSGAGLSGYLTSGSTHRSGVVSNPDLTAEVLAFLGLERPVQVIGNTLSATPAPPGAQERIDHLQALNTTAIAQNAVRAPFAQIFVWLFVLTVVAAGALMGLGRWLPARFLRAAGAVVKTLVLTIASLAISGWTIFLAAPTVASPAEMWVELIVAALILTGLALLAWRFLGGRWPLAALLLFTSGLLVADQLLGAPLSRTNLLGYSPLDSARYYGIGNEAAALLVGATLAGLALLADELAEHPSANLVRRYAVPVAGALVVVVCAAPFFGANVGVAIWGTAGFAVAWALMTGQRITWRTAVVAGLIVVLLIGGFAVLDARRGGSQTHLARSIESAQQGGVAQLGLIVQRKAETNLRILAQSNWSIMLLVTAAFLVFLRVLPGDQLRRILAQNPALRGALWAAATAGVLAFLTEDTGIDVPSWIWLPLGLALVWLALSAHTASGERDAL